MSHQLENAKNLYLRGIRDGEIKEVHEHYMVLLTPSTVRVYLMRKRALLLSLRTFQTQSQAEISIVRTIEDGNFVFVHVHQKLNDGEAEWVTADIFRSDENGRIVEHWDVIDAYPKPLAKQTLSTQTLN